MDTRTRTASPTTEGAHASHSPPPPVQDKISAYYSLVFPHFTFYIQTLSITIGRRCAPNAATSSTSETPQVDVDLGALKSVSRLHAKIEYDQEEDRFVLVVIGRNGAWVDGVWSAAGTRAPLGERSQIQIASRTFHFVLPPPPPPEDTPSPSSQSSANRPRSPSVDITSISPPSSQPSHSPPPVQVKLPPPSPEPELSPELSPQLSSPPLQLSSPPPLPKPKIKPPAPPPRPPPPQPQLPNSNSIGQSSKANSKKRKKNDVEVPPILERPKPEDMPPKPPFTYAQLIYRGIRELGGKATLQEICTWIMNTHEYYRYAEPAWMSSVRHNLSSNNAFLKMERCGGDRGKGFFWSLDENYSQSLEEQEFKAKQAASAAAKGVASGSAEVVGKNRKKEKGGFLEPPLKRSVKGDTKGVPLPPPLTFSPLPFKTALSPAPTLSTSSAPAGGPSIPSGTQTTSSIKPLSVATTGIFAYPSLPHTMQAISPAQQSSTVTSSYSGTSLSGSNPYAPLAHSKWHMHGNVNPSPSTTATSSTATPAVSTPAPAPTPAPATPQPAQPGQTAVPDVVIPIILGPIPPTHPDYSPNHPNNSAKEGYMILHERKLILDPDIFAELTKEMLEKLEAMGARGALGVLTEHMIRALKERRARERGKERGGRRPRGNGRGGAARKAPPTTTGPFTNVPLDHKRKAPGAEVSNLDSSQPAMKSLTQPVPVPGPSATQSSTTASTDVASGPPVADPGSPIIIIDDVSEDEGPAAKKRKVEGGESVASG
ncbi:Fork head transcription factor 1 [Psilocybe cubensis]|uniref:Fork head transcription factor 1 n=2 Tax=Psilocybe cubensis TaxID=181762 RepID=A0ACB8H3J5_PSICU|nr:Fork head transcription factor 1 [Psilocybe cubensis]KAH9482424.1 Fork head transcription factor 1 [Psilocybe cubensis]